MGYKNYFMPQCPVVVVLAQAPAQQLKLQADVESVCEAAVPPHEGTSLRAQRPETPQHDELGNTVVKTSRQMPSKHTVRQTTRNKPRVFLCVFPASIECYVYVNAFCLTSCFAWVTRTGRSLVILTATQSLVAVFRHLSTLPKEPSPRKESTR